MASVATYLNFDGTCEEAFAFYREAFGGEYVDPPMRMSDLPPEPGQPPVPPEHADRIMHMAMDIVAGHRLMGSDSMPWAGHVLTPGNAMYVAVTLDDEDEARELFARLSAGGTVTMEPTPMFWGDLYSDFMDRYGIQWMVMAPLTEGTGLA